MPVTTGIGLIVILMHLHPNNKGAVKWPPAVSPQSNSHKDQVKDHGINRFVEDEALYILRIHFKMTNICTVFQRCLKLCVCLCARNTSFICIDRVVFFRIMKGQGIDIKSPSSRSVLTVTNMTEDRYGNYTCVASNKLGTANASVPLIRKLSVYLLVTVWRCEESQGWEAAVELTGVSK